MYHETLCEERDLLVLVCSLSQKKIDQFYFQSQMSFLSFQMHATKLTLTAGNFFMMNRKIMISVRLKACSWFLVDI